MITLIRLKYSLSFFSLREIIVLLIGKFSTRTGNYSNLLEKKNKIDFLFLRGFRILECNDSYFLIGYLVNNNPLKIRIRIASSDAYVLDQIFKEEDFRYVFELYKKAFSIKPLLIVDAGANIGCTIMYFLCQNPLSSVLAIEPIKSNLDLAKLNICLNNWSANVTFMEKALWPNDQKLSSSNKFRDGLEWSTTVSPNHEGRIDCITPNRLFEETGWSHIDLFKIDIEGAEAALFQKESDLSWLEKVKLISVEVHPEFVSIDTIKERLIQNGFEVTKKGELIVGLNSKFKVEPTYYTDEFNK